MSARQQMQESFLRLTQGSRSVVQYEAEFLALARYAPQLIPTVEERCYRFLRGLREELRHPLVPLEIRDFSRLVEKARLLENDLLSSQLPGDSGRKRFVGESSRSAGGKKSRFGQSDSGRSPVPSKGKSFSGSIV